MANKSQQGSLVRVLGRRDVIALSFGAMIGWSWVVLSGAWISGAGTLGAVVSFLIGGGIILLVGLTYAELASALPYAGGEHVYSERALGKGMSFVCTWSIILGYMSVISFEAVALPTVLSPLVPGLDIGYLWNIAGWDVYLTWVLTGIAGAILVTVLNIIGVKIVAVVQTVVILYILTAGLVLVGGATVSGAASNMQPLFSNGLGGLATILVMVPFMFVGFDVIPQAAEEINLPFRDIGAALILSVVMAIAWYCLIIMGVGLVQDGGTLQTEIPTAEAGRIIYGDTGATLILLAGLAGIMTSWNAFIVGASRAIYAMAKAGMLPAGLAKLHPKYNTPVNAIILIGALSVISPFFGYPALLWLVNAGGFGIVVAYLFVAISFVVLRRKEPDLDRPFRAPFGSITSYFPIALSVFLICLYLPTSPSALLWPQEWVIIIAWAVLGLILYRFR